MFGIVSVSRLFLMHSFDECVKEIKVMKIKSETSSGKIVEVS